MFLNGLHEHGISVRAWQPKWMALEKLFFIHRIRFCPSYHPIVFKPCGRKFVINMAIAMKISKAQYREFKRTAVRISTSPVFPPMASCMWHSADPVHLATLLFHLLKGIDILQRMTSNTVYWEVLQNFKYIKIYKNIYFLVIVSCLCLRLFARI